MAGITKRRLDSELVRRGLARSREDAAELVRSGRVHVAGITATKPSTGVASGVAIQVLDPGAPGVGEESPSYASRGAAKLIGALDAFAGCGLAVDGRRCLDAGASTGGFTDVLLRRGARQVIAVDVGYGQLDWRLRSDGRVTVLDRTNVRYLGADAVEAYGGVVDVVVADLSFISLSLVLPALIACSTPEADLLPMVKPQFEAGPGRVGRGGVVRDVGVRADCVVRVASAARALGLGTRGVTTSPLPGPSGNVEFFLWLRADAAPPDDDVIRAVVGSEGTWCQGASTPGTDPGGGPGGVPGDATGGEPGGGDGG